MGRRSTTGGVKPKGDRIEVRLTYHGQEIRPTLPLKPTTANLAHARRLRAQMVEEIARGTFDFERHFPGYRYKTKHQPAAQAGQRFGAWCDTWLALQARSLEHSTVAIYRRHLLAYWRSAWETWEPAQITHQVILKRLAELAAPRLDAATGKTAPPLSRKTQNNIMIPLRGVFDLIDREHNPCDGIANLRVQRPGADPFTLEEVDIVLRHLQATRGGELADYFEFAAFAGLRTSEQIALLWADVDLRTGVILVRRAKVLTEEKERTKTHREREVELNARARAVIERQRARTQLAGAEVFRNPFTGRAWNDEQEQRRDWTQALRVVGIRHRPPKELRDTSVTMALQAGASPAWVAAQHGHSLQVMMRDYAKWIPKGDRGRNLEAVNSALEPHYGDSGKEKSA